MPLEVGQHRQLAVGEAQDLVVLHRRDHQRTVGQPAEARRLLLDLDHHRLGAVGGDPRDLVAVEVGDPPGAVAPARPLEEPATLEQRGHVPFSHAAGRYRRQSASAGRPSSETLFFWAR